MKSLTIQINDLFEFEGQPVPAQRPDNAAVEAMVRRQFEFLRQPLQIEIGESAVIISFTEEASAAQDEAARLAERAAKRAGEGNYDKAISIWKRVLELSPSLHKARRDLAMACMESGDTESAKNHLIEVLRLSPADAWGWVVLGNLYAKNQKDWATAGRVVRRRRAVGGKEAAGFTLAGVDVENLQDLGPVRVLRVVEIPQIEQSLLMNRARRVPDIFDHAPVAMGFAVFGSFGRAQKHAELMMPQTGWWCARG